MLINILFLLQTIAPVSGDSGHRTPSGLWFRASGRGDAVVFLHGANLDSRSFGEVPARLAAAHRVVVTDLRSHGRSADAAGPFAWHDDLIEVLDAAAVDRAVVVGNSLGAQIAVDAALAHPGRIAGLVLIGPSVGGLPPTRMPEGFEGLIGALRQGDLPAAGRLLGAMAVMRLYRDTTNQPLIRSIVADNVRLFRADRGWLRPLDPPASGRLGQLAVPVLVIVGERDPTEAEAASSAMVERAPKVRVERLPGCGHLSAIDCPEEVTRLITGFSRGPGH